MKKAVKILCAAAFLLVCALVLSFFAPLTETGGALPVLEWESAAAVDAGGRETTFDIYAPAPALSEGGRYRFSLTLPERDTAMFLSFDGSSGWSVLRLDGEEIYSSRAGELSASVDITLLPGGGERLVLDCAPEGGGVFPPLIQLRDSISDQREDIAYANYYAVPAGAMALVLVLLCGLFLLSAASRSPNWRLLPLIFASAALVFSPLTQGFGVYFFTETEMRVLGWDGWDWLAALALAAYLALHRSRRFWALLGGITAASALLLLGCWGASALSGGYLARYMASLGSELASGYYGSFLYWLTSWLALVCALLSGWELLRAYTSALTQARTLELKNRLVADNYRAIEAKLRESAALRHEFAHRLTVMDAYLAAGDYESLAGCLADWREESGGALRTRYTGHIAVNAILQEAANRAAAAGVKFEASAQLPPELPVKDPDLCALLMNMLDNALEGAERTPAGRGKTLCVHLRAAGGFLAVRCVNSFDGRVELDEHGRPRSTKPEPESHGFGLEQMRAVAEKYGSILDLSWTETEFTVQTALKI